MDNDWGNQQMRIGNKFLIRFRMLPIIVTSAVIFVANGIFAESSSPEIYEIKGVVYAPEYFSPMQKREFLENVTIHVKSGDYIGFISENGAFTVCNVPSGSYIIQTLAKNFMYEPVKIEINSKGKIRARKVNYIQSSQVTQLPYPLKLKPLGAIQFFQLREQWRITDFLFNPMVLMMILPMLVIMILPRVIQDEERNVEPTEQFQLPKYDMPEVSEMITSFFSGGDASGSGSSDRQNIRSIKQRKNK